MGRELLVTLSQKVLGLGLLAGDFMSGDQKAIADAQEGVARQPFCEAETRGGGDSGMGGGK